MTRALQNSLTFDVTFKVYDYTESYGEYINDNVYGVSHNNSIKEILDFSPGTIIELDKLAGEPVDVLVNGKFVAKGEVVVIEENFGIRLVEISK